MLSLFRHGPLAVLRIHDLDFSGVVSSLVKSLPADVESLMLVTPTDTKMFGVNNADGTAEGAATRRQYQPPHRIFGEPESSDANGEEAIEDPQEEAIRLAEEDASQSQVEQAHAAADAAPLGSAERARAMREARRAEAGEASDPCRRCNGSGQIAIALPDGGASQAACGVCRGAGVIRRFGERRAR